MVNVAFWYVTFCINPLPFRSDEGHENKKESEERGRCRTELIHRLDRTKSTTLSIVFEDLTCWADLTG